MQFDAAAGFYRLLSYYVSDIGMDKCASLYDYAITTERNIWYLKYPHADSEVIGGS